LFSFESDPLLVDDREDLIAVIRMRFGEISGEMIQQIYSIEDYHILQGLIIAAANATTWNVFLEEFQARDKSFRLLGEDFNPLSDSLKGRIG
jgi:hypothetical protein